MKILIIVFIVLAIISSLSSITYVTADVVVEQRNKKLEAERQKTQNGKGKHKAETDRSELPAEAEVFPEIVERVDAIHADEMLSNTLAMRMVSRERGAGRGKQEVVNIGDIDQSFEAGAVVTLAELKAKGLVPKGAGRVKVLAGGMLNKPLTVKAENFSIQAIKMIELTGGTVVIMKND